MKTLADLWRKVDELSLDFRMWRDGLIRLASSTGGGTAAGTTVGSGGCRCNENCYDAGSITACADIPDENGDPNGEAALNYYISNLDTAMSLVLGSGIVFTHDSGCDWVSDLFEAKDFGDGAHDYDFTLNFAGVLPGEVTIVMEDET